MGEIQKTRIMIVDDDGLVRATLAMRLGREERFEIVAMAATADEAVERACALRPDVVLMDIDLGGADSLHATRTIAEKLPDTRIVFVSALKHDRLIDFALAQGVHGFVTKGEPIEMLLDAIDVVVRGEQFLSAAIADRLVPPPAGDESSPGVTRTASLTPRQRQILTLIAMGRSKKEIAHNLHVSIKTVEAHSYRLMKRLGCNDRVELARQAIREGLIAP